MRTLVLSVLALGAFTTVALAEPVTPPPPATTGPVDLTDEQMDQATAGYGYGYGYNKFVFPSQAFLLFPPGPIIHVPPNPIEPLSGHFLFGGD